MDSVLHTIPKVNGMNSMALKTDYWNFPKSDPHPFFALKGGYINYNYSYRSYLDTPYAASNIQQHLVTASANVLIAQKIPVRVSVYERQTNSPYFRNYTDVRVEFNAQEYRRMQMQKLNSYYAHLLNGLDKPELRSGMDLEKEVMSKLSSYINSGENIKRYLQSKETVINKDVLHGPGEYRDSLVKEAEAYIAFFEQKQKDLANATHYYDSLQNEYRSAESRIRNLKGSLGHDLSADREASTVKDSLRSRGINDSYLNKLINNLYSVHTLIIGRSVPDYTDLTVKNINVNGLNAEFSRNSLYTAVVAGAIDFNVRDFVLNRHEPVHQYVTAGRIGWGTRFGNHIIFTGYRGRRQLFSSVALNNSATIFGVSVEAQLVLNRNIRLTGEIAQSGTVPTPGLLTDSTAKIFSLNDKNSRAWSLGLHGYFPRSKTGIDGMWERQGINFESFNAYKVNGQTDIWNVKADQYLWAGLLHLTVGLNKNNYENPLIQQNYNSNSVFTTVTATLNKRHWPVVSIGFIPSSQYSVINNFVYESRYEALNINSSYFYKLGKVHASTTAMYNRFYNSGSDTGFVYYNARNFFFSQNIMFTTYSAGINISHTENPQYFLDVMEAGLQRSFGRKVYARLGIKLDHLNTNESDIGYSAGFGLTMAKIGVINISGEKSYLPSTGNVLVKNEFINITFTRFFK